MSSSFSLPFRDASHPWYGAISIDRHELVTRTFRSAPLSDAVLKSTGNKNTARNTLVAVRGVLANRRQDHVLFFFSSPCSYFHFSQLLQNTLDFGGAGFLWEMCERLCRRHHAAVGESGEHSWCHAALSLAWLDCLINKHPAWFRAVPQSVAEIYTQSRPSCPCYVNKGRGPPLETSKALFGPNTVLTT